MTETDTIPAFFKMWTPLFCAFVLVLILFVPTEGDYLLKVFATKNVDGKDTRVTRLTCRRFRAGFPVRRFLFGLFLLVWSCTFSFIVLFLFLSVYGCLFLHLSPLMNWPLVCGRLHLPPLPCWDPADSQSPGIFSLLVKPPPPSWSRCLRWRTILSPFISLLTNVGLGLKSSSWSSSFGRSRWWWLTVSSPRTKHHTEKETSGPLKTLRHSFNEAMSEMSI